MVSAGIRRRSFAALLAVMTEANDKQCNWPGFETPNSTTGSAIYARVFRVKLRFKREGPISLGARTSRPH